MNQRQRLKVSALKHGVRCHAVASIVCLPKALACSIFLSLPLAKQNLPIPSLPTLLHHPGCQQLVFTKCAPHPPLLSILLTFCSSFQKSSGRIFFCLVFLFLVSPMTKHFFSSAPPPRTLSQHCPSLWLYPASTASSLKPIHLPLTPPFSLLLPLRAPLHLFSIAHNSRASVFVIRRSWEVLITVPSEER